MSHAPSPRQKLLRRLCFIVAGMTFAIVHIATIFLIWLLKLKTGLGKSDLRPIQHLEKVDSPILFLAGSKDRRTTPDESQMMFDTAAQPKQIHFFQNAPHVDFHHFAPELYESLVIAFLREHLK